MFDLSRLTPEQRQALTCDRHVFVEASAGSGKTAVLVARYLHILATYPDCDPTQILAVTYTRKAATEMRHRIRHALETAIGNTLEDQIRIQHCLSKLPFATMTTIHAFCKDMIAEHSYAAGLSPQIEVPSDDDREWAWQRTLSSAIHQMIDKRDPRLATLLASQSILSIKEGITQLYKRDEISKRFADRDDDDSHYSSELQSLFQEIRALFQSEKQRMGWLDFPDMISEMAALVSENPAVAETIHQQYRFVMVDEFQDTDRVQWQLFQTLFLQAPQRNMFLVGDLKQAIYRFRGAEPHLFAEVRQWMRDNSGIVVELTQNFRSQQPLITFSNRLFKALFESSPTVDYAALQAVKQDSDRHVYLGLITDNTRNKASDSDIPSESDLILSWIISMKAKHGANWSDFAILCRKKTGLSRMADALQSAGIPVQQQQQITINIPLYYQDMYMLTTLLVYPYDAVAWTGVLRSRFIGMPDNDLVVFHQKRLATMSLSAALSEPPQNANPTYQKAATLLEQILSLRQHYPLGKALAVLCDSNNWRHPETLGYSESTQDANTLISQIGLWDSHAMMSDPDRLERLENWLLKGQMTEADTQNNSIQVMTIHKSKGLEFPFVIVPECGRSFHASRGRKLIISDSGIVSRLPGQEETFKSHMAAEEQDSMDEEKRIFYVACTRAKEELLLTGTVKLTEEFPEDFSPSSFWEFLAPYAKTTENEVHLQLPVETAEDSPSLSCQRWTTGGSVHGRQKAKPFVNASLSESHLPRPVGETIAHKPLSEISEDAYNGPTNPAHTSKISKWETLMGTLIHRILADIWQSDAVPTPEETQTIIDQHLTKQFGDSASALLTELLPPVATHVHNTLQSALANAIFSSSQKHCEWPFSWTDGQNTRDGRIDLLFHNENRWHIVDFKTTETPEVTPDMLQTLIQYQKAAAAFLEISPNDIQTSVFFTATGEWIGL